MLKASYQVQAAPPQSLARAAPPQAQAGTPTFFCNTVIFSLILSTSIRTSSTSLSISHRLCSSTSTAPLFSRRAFSKMISCCRSSAICISKSWFCTSPPRAVGTAVRPRPPLRAVRRGASKSTIC